MLSVEDNQRITRVGPGTEMGNLMRQYWIPFLQSKDVEIDGQPYRIKLLGEDLVAYRGSDGLVGLVDHACPHRGAPMVFGRNEKGGLRCVYHGWKFDTTGRCHDMPAEPENSPMVDRVKIKSYPVRERNGILWAYMGNETIENMPSLPNVEWNLVPVENVAISMRIQECNWLQALEGEIDSAHAAILHGRVDASGSIDQWKQAKDLSPKFECVTHDAGVSIGSRRKVGNNQNYIRVNQFLMPFWTFVPPFSQYPELSGHAWVPMDDEHTLCVMFSYHPTQPLYEKTRKIFNEGHAGRESAHASQGSFLSFPVTTPYRNYWSKFNRSNAYQFSYESQVDKFNSGMPGLWIQDAACQSGVAAIYDRSKEHLGTTDTGIAMTRRLLLQSLKKLTSEGLKPPSSIDPNKLMFRAISILVPEGGDWQSLGKEYMKAELGKDFGYAP